MYHDQSAIAMKMLGFDRGLSLHGGIPVPITTPAQGSAYDIRRHGHRPGHRAAPCIRSGRQARSPPAYAGRGGMTREPLPHPVPPGRDAGAAPTRGWLVLLERHDVLFPKLGR